MNTISITGMVLSRKSVRFYYKGQKYVQMLNVDVPRLSGVKDTLKVYLAQKISEETSSISCRGVIGGSKTNIFILSNEVFPDTASDLEGTNTVSISGEAVSISAIRATRRKDRKDRVIRSFLLKEDSMMLPCVLWGKQASSFEEENGPVVLHGRLQSRLNKKTGQLVTELSVQDCFRQKKL